MINCKRDQQIKIFAKNLFRDGSTKHAAKVAQEGLNRNFILLISKDAYKHNAYAYANAERTLILSLCICICINKMKNIYDSSCSFHVGIA